MDELKISLKKRLPEYDWRISPSIERYRVRKRDKRGHFIRGYRNVSDFVGYEIHWSRRHIIYGKATGGMSITLELIDMPGLVDVIARFTQEEYAYLVRQKDREREPD